MTRACRAIAIAIVTRAWRYRNRSTNIRNVTGASIARAGRCDFVDADAAPGRYRRVIAIAVGDHVIAMQNFFHFVLVSGRNAR